MVGGGPTGVEFSGELSDFIMKDVRQRYAHVKDDVHVTLIEVCFQEAASTGSSLCVFHHFTIVSVLSDYLQAKDILSSFDDRLRRYAIKQLNKVSSLMVLKINLGGKSIVVETFFFISDYTIQTSVKHS